MGFWRYPGRRDWKPSEKWMAELLEAQRKGDMVGDSSRLDLGIAGEITVQSPIDSFPGHAAWLDWPWKLHRIHDMEGNIRWELYHLERDPMESEDLAEKERETAAKMKPELEAWQTSVVQSMNGLDYE